MLPECVALNLSFCDFQSCANFGCVLATVFPYFNWSRYWSELMHSSNHLVNT